MTTIVLEHHKVPRGVVVGRAVAVMYDLRWQQVATEHRFGNEPVLAHIPGLGGMRMIGAVNEHIALFVADAASPPRPVALRKSRPGWKGRITCCSQPTPDRLLAYPKLTRDLSQRIAPGTTRTHIIQVDGHSRWHGMW